MAEMHRMQIIELSLQQKKIFLLTHYLNNNKKNYG